MKRTRFVSGLLPADVRACALERTVLMLVAIALCLLLASCGGAAPTHTFTPSVVTPTPTPPNPPAPVFGSVPPTAAAEGQMYSYNVSASDPGGGVVTLALTNGPEGAVLSAGVVSWTPIWEQSRKPNGFQITATNAKGQSANQTWSVSPSGTVYRKLMRKWFAADGTVEEEVVQIPSWATGPGFGYGIYLPNPSDPNNGYLKEICPVILADGRLKYSNIPAGPFYAGQWLWTDKSEINSEEVIIGRRTDPNPYPANATATGTVAGIVWEEGQDNVYTQLAFRIPNVRGYSETNHGTLDPKATVWSGGFMIPPFDAAKGDIAYLTEVARSQRTSPVGMNIDQMVATAAMDHLSVPDRGNVPFSVALTPVPRDRSFRVNLLGAKWQEALQQVQTHPGAFVLGVDFNVSLTPFSKNTSYTNCPDPGGPIPCLISVGAAPGAGAVYGRRDPANFPAADLDLGTFHYGNPFPETWGLNFSTTVVASAEYALPGNEPVSTTGEIGYAASSVPAEGEVITPVVTPVTRIMLDGKDASAGAVTIGTVTPTLSWTPPAGAPPIVGYIVDARVLIHDEYCENGPPTKSWCWFLDYGGPGTATDQTSVTLTPAIVDLFTTGDWLDGGWKVYGAVLKVRVIAEAEAHPQSGDPVYRTGWADAFTQLIYFRP